MSESPVLKRLCQRPGDVSCDSRAARSNAGFYLLSLLQPICRCLHPFLSSADAARLMQASRTITASLLTDYGFVDHVFELRTVTATERSLAFYARYHKRILRLRLPVDWNEPLLDAATGQSVLPASLVALTIGEAPDGVEGQCVVHAAFNGGRDQQRDAVRAEEGQGAAKGEGEFERLIRPVDVGEGTEWSVLHYGSSSAAFDQLLSPGALPQSLRFLQLNDEYNQPLQAGSLPDRRGGAAAW